MSLFHTDTLKLIESPANPLIKVLSGLKTSKGRREQKQILIESLHPVEEALDAGLEVTHLLLRADRADALYNALANRFDDKLDTINDVLRLSDTAMARITTTDSAPEIIAIAEVPTPPTSLQSTESTLALYNLKDPGNIGTLLRSALAFGVRQIALIGDTHADPYQPKIIRASAGLLFKTQLMSFESLEAFKAHMPESLPIIGLDAHGEHAINDFSWPECCVILLGSEGTGLPKTPHPITTVHIPMTADAESLNVAIAGSIVLHAQYQHLKTAQ